MRRTVLNLLSKSKRTIVRSPRRRRRPSSAVATTTDPKAGSSGLQTYSEQQHQLQQQHQLPFAPSASNQQQIGSSLGSYMLAGAGMAVGFSIVGAVFGGF
uniref:Uncharacterized protein n=1 Tax=Craspedostauros australis TaxID=1486917 RepID=A0A7R9ZI73_9STRA|mmetsp:Transcript_10057/g.27566  ORF Transcript_10057/g.27566 Transcript_10057/m.27566 type:complete len:100 (+) Transcript_10057:357-656(+)|eukprot:CAMPEP_0198126058 /NCGR_PEP_ID=MMETSP1442-20131203/43954_1 /TAXON_ID= /ORGANISM="Craspedostauros australis, Strain CCMP3328" /LENGTH=99 /DNA_ID=CAMNT_0043785771 /DNA_START=283 /DNA_END=582 /DNA_ORIENTATION=+